jgi:hypothetical protein
MFKTYLKGKKDNNLRECKTVTCWECWKKFINYNIVSRKQYMIAKYGGEPPSYDGILYLCNQCTIDLGLTAIRTKDTL